MRKLLVLVSFVFAMNASAADVSISIGSPNLRIGVDVREYPDLVPIRGYPVYYAPHMDSNYFFYDGLYWVYQNDSWYASSWFNGPWSYVDPYVVPVYVLRVPVRYYRRPPTYFHGWERDSAPHWHDHWGPDWHHRRHDWDRWDRRNAPKPPPLPTYQRRYVGDRYPDSDRQRELQQRNYHYQPRNPVVADHYRNEHHNDQWRDRDQRGDDRRQQREREQQQRREDNQRQEDRRHQQQRDQDNREREQRQREQDQRRQESRRQEQQQNEQHQQRVRQQADQANQRRQQEDQRRQEEQRHRQDDQRHQQDDQRRQEDQRRQQDDQRRQEDQRRQQDDQQQNEQRQSRQRDDQQRQDGDGKDRSRDREGQRRERSDNQR